MKRFLLAFGGILAIVIASSFALVRTGIVSVLPSFFWEILIFLGFGTVVIVHYLIRSKAGQFVQLYLLTMVIKLLAYAGFAVFVILGNRPGASLNITFFLIIYLVFTGAELAFLYPKINR